MSEIMNSENYDPKMEIENLMNMLEAYGEGDCTNSRLEEMILDGIDLIKNSENFQGINLDLEEIQDILIRFQEMRDWNQDQRLLNLQIRFIWSIIRKIDY